MTFPHFQFAFLFQLLIASYVLHNCCVYVVSSEVATKIVDEFAIRIEEVDDDGVIHLEINDDTDSELTCCKTFLALYKDIMNRLTLTRYRSSEMIIWCFL